MQFSYTLIIVIFTVVTSVMAFSNENIINKFIMYPYGMRNNPKEYHRLFTHSLIHADVMHLAFNMLALYFFGRIVEYKFAEIGKPYLYPALYILGVVAASLPDMVRHSNHSYFRSLGASGGVSAVIFSSVYFMPWSKIGIMFIPGDGIWGIAFAALYLAFSVYMAKRGDTRVNHYAHFWGAIFGFVFTFLFDPTHGQIFLIQIMNPPI